MKKSILFVDDQPEVLQALRRMLRPLRHEWEMEFVESGARALETLDQGNVDVIVSDMRMPVMNGAELLSEIMHRHPATARIILSGQSGADAILRSVGPAHQFLAKPCDAGTLKETIRKACRLQDKLLADRALRSIVSRIGSLPSLPSLYTEIMKELRSPDPSIQRIGAIVSRDIAMSARLLQLVNSAFFGLPRRVTDPAQAVGLLGVKTIKALVMSSEVFSQFEADRMPATNVSKLWQHSLLCGDFAKKIARLEGFNQEERDQAYMAGLLHDIGKLLLAFSLPEEYGNAMTEAEERGEPQWQLELEHWGVTHAQVGAYLLGLWGLPDELVDAVSYHHSPGNYTGAGIQTLTALHVADVLANEKNDHSGATQLDQEFLTALGLDDRPPAWRESLAETNAG